MRFCIFLFVMVALCLPHEVRAQHAGDLVIGYDDRSNPMEFQILEVDRTAEGLLIFESDFVELDPFDPGEYSSDLPGFNTDPNGLRVNDGDEVWLTLLDAREHSSVGKGYVSYYNPATDAVEAAGRLAVQGNRSNPDLVVNGDVVESGDNQQYIDRGGNGGNLHDHIVFDLLDDDTTSVGAYGILAQLQVDFSAVDGEMDLNSEPFWVIFNFGMDTNDFNTLALPNFEGQSLLGDFDEDGDVDLADLDRYIGNIGEAAVGEFEELDLNSDGTVGVDDFAQHYGTLVETSNGGKGTFQGDINLDGTVNVLGDAFALVGNLGTSATSWNQGDINASGNVDVLGDAFALVGNLGNSNGGSSSAPSTTVVPEPSSFFILVFSGMSLMARRR